MVTEVAMPVLGLTMEEGTVLKWLKAEGEPVAKGEPLLEVMTDKVNVVVDSPGSGMLRRVVVGEGATVPVKTLLAYIAEPDEVLPGATPTVATPLPEAPNAFKTLAVANVQDENPRELKISPAARRVAREHGLTEVQMAGIKGSGPGGRIVEDDVRSYLQRLENAPSTIPGRTVPVTGLRKTIAERMSRSKRTVADVTLGAEVDVTEATKLRDQLVGEWEGKTGLRVSFTDIVIKAAARALAEHPKLNSSLGDDGIVLHGEINVGVAVAVDDGLVVPVIRRADQKTLLDIVRTTRELSERARSGGLSVQDVTGGTFTVTNLGMFGVGFFTPIINHPEAAILGVGKIVRRVILENGHPVERPEMSLSLSFDHRIVDGVPAAQFLSRIKELLANPHLLFV